MAVPFPMRELRIFLRQFLRWINYRGPARVRYVYSEPRPIEPAPPL